MDKLEALNKYFGYSAFRPGQQELIDTLLSGRDVIGIMPTGAGKSVCFQLPALLLEGITIVISPLISLMQDQVNALNQCGIRAAYINGALSVSQRRKALEKAARGEYKIIYVAPERLELDNFAAFCKRVKISMVCVDEAHCVSQWGHDFRPAYLSISSFIASIKPRPVVSAFTATATTRVREDIETQLGLLEPERVITGFDRSNLYFEVVRPSDKYIALKRYLDMFSGRSGIVYCSSRRKTDELYTMLGEEKYSVTKYHAGLTKEERAFNQELFIKDDKEIVIATNAFGMGIDKSNVSFVIHYNMPGDLESYYQEAGRAGRDGSPADCILLYSGRDVAIQKFFIENPEENDELTVEQKESLRQLRYDKLDKIIEYASGKYCLRHYILRYFGEKPTGKCENCSCCIGVGASEDITLEGQKIFSCIKRLGEREPLQTVVDVLKGETSERVLLRGYDKIKTFCVMQDYSRDRIEEFIEYLTVHGYISEKSTGSLALSDKCKAVLFEGRRIRRPAERADKPQKKETQPDMRLLSALKITRRVIAKRINMPDFIIFTDATLRIFATEKPTDMKSFLAVDGVSAEKFRKYGEAFIQVIVKHCDN